MGMMGMMNLAQLAAQKAAARKAMVGLEDSLKSRARDRA